MKHQEGAEGLGADRKDATEGGVRDEHLAKVLLRGNIGGAVVWVRDLSVVRDNGAEARGISCGVPETGDKVKGKEAEGRFLAEGGGKQITSGSGLTTDPDSLGQDIENSGEVGGPMDRIQCMCKGYGLLQRGEAPGDVVETGGNRETAEGCGRRYFGGGKGAAVAGIRQVR